MADMRGIGLGNIAESTMSRVITFGHVPFDKNTKNVLQCGLVIFFFIYVSFQWYNRCDIRAK